MAEETLADLFLAAGVRGQQRPRPLSMRPAWQRTPEANTPYRAPQQALADRNTLPYLRQETRNERRQQNDLAQFALEHEAARNEVNTPPGTYLGQDALEMTGLPSVARGIGHLRDQEPGQALPELALGGLGVFGMVAGGGARTPRARPPMRAALPELPTEAPRLPNAPARLPGRATDGSVLPIRPPQPIRQSMVGGSDDLAEAAAMRPQVQGDPEALSLARSWIDTFGGGPEAEARAISVMEQHAREATHPLRRQLLEEAVASVRSRQYVRGEPNTFSARVEEAWPEIYGSRSGPDARPAQGGRRSPYQEELRAQGFDVESPLYRGMTRQAEGGDFTRNADLQGSEQFHGTSFSRSTSEANLYAMEGDGGAVYPAYMRGRLESGPDYMRAVQARARESGVTNQEAARQVQQEYAQRGVTGVEWPPDRYGKGGEVRIFDQSNTASPFGANAPRTAPDGSASGVGQRLPRRVVDLRTPRGETHETIVNPSEADILRLTRPVRAARGSAVERGVPLSSSRGVRYIKDTEGNIYVGNSYDVTHHDLVTHYGLSNRGSLDGGEIVRLPDGTFELQNNDGAMPLPRGWLNGLAPDAPDGGPVQAGRGAERITMYGPDETGAYTVEATVDGKLVGRTDLFPHEGGFAPEGGQVIPAFQRQGVMSRILQHAEQEIGASLRRPMGMTDEGRAMWEQYASRRTAPDGGPSRLGPSLRGFHGSSVEGLSELRPGERGPMGPATYLSPNNGVAGRYGPNIYEADAENIFHGLGSSGFADSSINPYEVWRSQLARLVDAAEPSKRAEITAIAERMHPQDGYPFFRRLANLYGSDEAAQALFRRAGFTGISGHVDGPEIAIFGNVTTRNAPNAGPLQPKPNGPAPKRPRPRPPMRPTQ